MRAALLGAASCACRRLLATATPVARMTAETIGSVASTAAASVAYPRRVATPTRRGDRVRVVLRSQLDNVGHAGEEVTVSPGYARNYLLPQRLASLATAEARAAHCVILSPEAARANAQQREINMLRRRVGEVRLRFARATADGATLYSAVTATDVAEALASSVLRKLGVREKQVRMAALAAAEPAAPSTTSAAAAGGSAGTSSDGGVGSVSGGGTTGSPAPFAITRVGDHSIEIEARPGLWCQLTVEVQSS